MPKVYKEDPHWCSVRTGFLMEGGDHWYVELYVGRWYEYLESARWLVSLLLSSAG